MSDISISSMTMSSMAYDNQMQGAETVKETSRESMSGINMAGIDSSNEQAVVGLEVASRTNEYIGASPDFSSTGTEFDFVQAANSMQDGNGTIADKVV